MPAPVIASSVRAIALIEWAKGAVALAFAAGILIVPAQQLQHWLLRLAEHLHIGHRHGPFALIDRGIGGESLDLIAALCGGYALLRAAEGWGLWHQRRWAAWLGVLSTAIYLPFDVLALRRHPGVMSDLLLLLNLGLIALLWLSLKRKRHG